MGDTSAYALGKKTGITQGLIRNYIRGLSVPGADKVVLMAKNLGVRPGWLLSGEEPMLEADHIQVAEGLAPYMADFALVPKYDVEASAGGGREIVSEEEVGRFAFRRDWLAERGLKADRLALIAARGDSMHPTIEPGDTLLVDLSPAPVRDGIYVIRMGGELHVKRLQRLPGGRAKVRSDNAAYEAFEIPLNGEWVAENDDQVGRDRVVGRVVWIGHVIQD
ncbi:MAG TPA: helix-turn-helix transcriptional regulator [Gammaproteobacteria bacterium]|nr:helix-turn-helix transcriptional regulator [Gammaproteobacteria bacterium]